MRIGILTYHCVPNFGAQLQTVSTVGYLKKMNHEPIVLHWYPDDVKLMYEKRVPSIQIQAHDKFTSQFLPISSLCKTEVDLIKEINNLSLDCIIIGSDAVFKYIPKSERFYFSFKKMRFVKRKILSVEDFVENPFFCSFYDKLEKKIPIAAFSVSSQNSLFKLVNSLEKEILHKYLSNFSIITVRDEWTKKMVEYLLNPGNIKVTPDPVFAFNYNSYIDLPSKEYILQKFNLPPNYVLLSFRTNSLSSSYINEVVSYLQKENYYPVAFPMPEGLKVFNMEFKIQLPISPLDWYALIVYACGYIGERMHPIVVSIHNKVPFFCFDEYGYFEKRYWGIKRKYIKKSSKTYHILDKAGLTKYLYSYKGTKKLPSPEEIVKHIKFFDYDGCDSFAHFYHNEYIESMEFILNKLKK